MPRHVPALVCVLALTAACGSGAEETAANHNHDAAASAMPTPAASDGQTASGTFLNNAGEEIGTAALQQGPHGVMMQIELGAGSLTPGWHGFHFHETGDCSDHDGFMASGGHHGKALGAHGLMNPDGPEPGDLPNLYAHTDGTAVGEFFTQLLSLTDGPAPIFDEDGISMVIHALPDDHISQPIGGAGPRVACALLSLD